MGFLRIACFLLVALPITSLSILKFRQDKDAAKELDHIASSLEKEFFSAALDKINIGGRKLVVKNNFMGLVDRKKKKKSPKQKIVRKLCEKEEKISTSEKKKGVYNADYMTYMHHPPKHN